VVIILLFSSVFVIPHYTWSVSDFFLHLHVEFCDRSVIPSVHKSCLLLNELVLWKMADSIAMLFEMVVWMGQRNDVLDGVQIPPPTRNGNFCGDGGNGCGAMYQIMHIDNAASAIQKQLNLLSCHLGW